ncbi:class I SAM-dependent methyltransferase [Jatrophihabitans sp.]|uniref:class I SAM-dependent methyltransferase n=1 Tax=Jatrophihabitans sp. TaxID=1932789 RepID=UPI0030C70D9B|nr:kamB [Jatrophihabitans sp.]
MIRRVVGRSIAPVADFAELRAGRRLLLDVGTGDGKHVLHEARQRSDWLVVGVDAAPAQLQRASTSAARKPAKGGLPNALFAQASAEQLPAALGPVDELHVLMPWGSLLRGCLAGETVLPSLRAVAAPAAALLITLNLHAWRPPVAEVGSSIEPTPASVLDGLAGLYAAAGWRIETASYLDEAGIAALATSWGRRLHSTREQFDVLAIHAVAV